MDTTQTATPLTDELLPGDLFFQLRTGGEAEWGISRLFVGRDGIAVNHVGIYDGDGQVIEAVMPEVRKTEINDFIARSVMDNHGYPCVMVCRVRPEYSPLVIAALEFAENTLAHPYDAHYSDTKKSWYCSELVVDAFRHANNGQFLFQETPMSFRDMESGELLPYWVNFYQSINKDIPEGQPGSHPALLSRSEKILVVNILGSLPATESLLKFNIGSGSMLA